MSNVLTGIPRESQKTQGGIMDVYIAPYASVSGATVTAGTATFKAGANVFKHFVVSKEAGSNFKSTLTGNVANGTVSFEQVLQLMFKRNQVAKRNELAILAVNELVVVIKDNDNSLYVIGLKTGNDFGGADVTTAEASTGAQMADSNSLSITLRALESHPAFAISEETFTSIENGTALV